MDRNFEAVCAFLAESDWNVLFTMTFADVCRKFGAMPQKMERMLYDAFGMSGDEIISHCRKGDAMADYVKTSV